MENFFKIMFGSNFMQIIGSMLMILFTYYIIMPLCKIFITHLIKARLLSKRRDLASYGSWAVVTGATDGIGKAYAEALASDGLNIVLISRSRDKLESAAKEIESEYKVKTRIHQADFTNTGIYEEIRCCLSGLDIGCLVNNVGISYDHPEYFDSERLEDRFFVDMVNCNVNSVMQMTRIVLPDMIERNRGGAIINISSAAGAFPMPLLTGYSATKSFVDFFSRALHQEMLGHGITVQSVLPFYVATKLSKIRRASWMAPSPASYVDSALGLLGVEARTTGCLVHALQHFVLASLPAPVRQLLFWRSLSALQRAAVRRAKLQEKDK